MKVDGVPVFAEGAPIKDGITQTMRPATRQDLDAICHANNRRCREYGTLTPLTLGHMDRHKPETEQPPIAGYAHNYRIGKFGPEQKTGILTTQYFRKPRTLPTQWNGPENVRVSSSI